jgi:nitrate reductase alpha subunit
MVWARKTTLNGKPSPDENGEMMAPNGSIGFRWGEKGKWNLEQRDGKPAKRPNCA